MILNLIFTERPYIYKIIKENFNKPIERNHDLSKFDINTCHLCGKKLNIIQLKIIVIIHPKCWDMLIINVILYKFKKDNVNDDYLINVFTHNRQNFDQSFLIRALQNLDNKIPFSCLPRKSNKFISLQKRTFIFKDSYPFLDKSLEYLIKTIDDYDRKSLKQEFGKIMNYYVKKNIPIQLF